MRCAILGFIGGAAWLHTQAGLPTTATLASLVLLALALAAALACFRLPPVARAGVALLAGWLCGLAWAAVVAHLALAPTLARVDEGRDFELVGVIDSLPTLQEGSTRFNLAVESPADVPPKVVLSWYAGKRPLPALRPGERWRLKVRLQRPHGNANPYGFDYELWLLEQGIRATGYVRTEGRNERLDDFVPSPRSAVGLARHALRERIGRALAGRKYGGVIAALVMGDQRGISQQDWQVFNRTGISHLVSISGLHITMIAGLVAWLIGWLWRKSFFVAGLELPLRMPAPRVAAIAGMAAGMAYVALAGFGVPAQRTLYMLAVVGVAVWTDRLTAISNVLALAAGVVVLLDPWAVMWPGFWLSFGAVAVILYATVGRAGRVRLPRQDDSPAAGLKPPAPDTLASHAVPGEDGGLPRWLENLRLAAATQYAVTIGLVPLTMLLFAQVSVVSPIANAIAIPVISLLVTPLALLGSVLPMVLAAPALQFAHFMLAVLVDALAWLAEQPMAVWHAPAPGWWQFALAAFGTAWVLAPRGWPARWLGLACWLPALAARPDTPPPGGLRVVAFDVGQGMALLVETAHHRLLYDTGPSYTPEANAGNRVILPYLRARGITSLDTLVVTHVDNDHSGGALAILGDIAVHELRSSLPASHPIVAAARQHQPCTTGQHWEWDGIRFDLLHPTAASYNDPTLKPNARGCTLRIQRGTQSILLPADIEAAQEAELVGSNAQALRADILLAPHHGSGTSSTPAFLAAVRPSHGVFQLGYRNRYRHPRADVVERYRAIGAEIWRTDQAGAITIDFGEKINIESYRQTHARYWHGR